MSNQSQPRIDTQPSSSNNQPTSILLESPLTIGNSQNNSSSSASPVVDTTKRSARRPPSRIIRTFNEIHVTKTINAEEWYEELECGVCAHVLGAPQTLVPCGHSLCGPCAWEWIKKNENLTCPHCRHQLHEALPFVPNIVVDQIISRKIQGLPDSPEKNGIIQERHEKAEAWKLIQDAIKPQIPRRRNFDDTVFGLFGLENNLNNGHNRRASRHVAALGAPLVEARPALAQLRRPTHPYGSGMNLAEIRRHEEEQNLPDRAEIRRLREASLRDAQIQFQAPPLEILPESVEVYPVGQVIRPSIFHSPPPPVAGPSGLQRPDNRRARSGSEVPQGPRVLSTRGLTQRSRVLADRQARGRGGDTREQPLVVLSDSD